MRLSILYHLRIILFFSFLVGAALPAHAQYGSSSTSSGGPYYFEETFFPVYVDKNDTTSITTSPGVATETGLGFDLRTTMGYVFWDALLVGLSYNYYSLSTSRPNVQGGDSGLKETTSDEKFGPTLGWINGGFRSLFTFFVSGSKEVHTKNFDATSTTGDVTITNRNISGFELTLGYTFQLWSVMQIGPSLIYSSVEYAKQSKLNRLNATENYSNSTLYSSNKYSDLRPMLTLLVRF